RRRRRAGQRDAADHLRPPLARRPLRGGAGAVRRVPAADARAVRPAQPLLRVRDRTLLFTGNSGTPLIRYHISDEGGLLEYDALLDRLWAWGFDPLAAPELAGTRVRRM